MIDKSRCLVAATALGLAGQAWGASFVNGGFEEGTLNGWTGGGGLWTSAATSAPLSPASYAGGTPNNAVMNVGIDPITGANTVYGGAHSVRVNDSVNNRSVSTLSQSVSNYTENNIFFAWNAVLEESHNLGDSDHFSLTLVDDTTSTTIVSRAYSSAGSIGSGTTGVTWSTFGDWFSSGWVVENIDLVALGAVGHDFTLSLLAADCPYSGHAGYVYLDGFGSVTPPTGGNVPAPGALALLGIGAIALGAARRRS